MKSRAITPAADSAARPAVPLTLRAGPLEMQYEDGSLRYLRLGNREVIRRIYIAVRDRNWGTVPAQVTVTNATIDAESFTFAYEARARRGDIDFCWRAEITGSARGAVSFTMDGRAMSDFLRNRIGFCILHPPRECAGARCRVRDAHGQWHEARFPSSISPANPFADFTGIAHELLPETWCRLELSGDLFEMEDQRNWLDASFKTFCTPLRLPFPVAIRTGTVVRQAIHLEWEGALPTTVNQAVNATIGLNYREASPQPLPRIGLATAEHGRPLSKTAVARLGLLRPAHLRVELRLDRPSVREVLQQAALASAALNCPLEIALFLGAAPERELAGLADQLRTGPPKIVRWLIYRESELAAANARWVDLARRELQEFAPDATFGTGTDHWFVYLNRSHPPATGDHVSFSLTPQVHAQDDASLVETLAMHTDVIARAQEIVPGVPVIVSPVTLRMRTNPAATSAPVPTPAGELPEQVDPRQCTLFGAGWTLGSIKYLAEAGVLGATYYETTGARGVMETDAGSPWPGKFPSIAGAVFPLFHVFADLAEFAGGCVIATQSDDPLRVDILALEQGDRRRILVANLTAGQQTVTLPHAAQATLIRRLNSSNVSAAMEFPEQFRRKFEPLVAAGGILRVVLSPFELVCLDSVAPI